MRARAAAAVLVGVALSLSACAGSEDEPFRVAMLSDCYGPFSSTHEVGVAAAELPLIERGGTLRGRKPSSGVEGATVAGRPVELLIGCITGTQDVIPEARRLVEEEGADALVGPLYPQHGPVLRDYARRQPGTAFLIQPSGAPEVTLADPAPNVFRFTLDTAQSAAGLGAYAYHRLGWRTAATLADDTPYGWGNVAGFVAEFCALGGRVVDRSWLPLGADPASFATRIPGSVDGVYLGAAIFPMSGFVRRYAALRPAVASTLLVNAALLYDPRIARAARGLVAAGGDPVQPTATGRALVASFARAFPTIPAPSVLFPLAVPYRDGVEAVLQALERSDGAAGAKLVAALAELELQSAAGVVRLDANHQAVAANFLSRVVADGQGRPAVRAFGVVPEVEQTFGGYFRPGDPPPSRTSPACRRATPPPWASR